MSKYKRSQAIIIDFSDVFNFATKEHGINWNPCNDLFFGTVFEYKQIDCVEYDGKDYINTITKEQVAEMDSTDKAFAIMSHFLQVNKLTDEDVRIDSQ